MASRQDYLDLLKEYGLSEKDVSPIVRPEYWSDKTIAWMNAFKNRLRPNFFTQYDDFKRAVTSPSHFAILDFILESAQKSEAQKRIEQIESGNANLIISAIASEMKRRLDVTPDVSVYHGIFPTRVFNAQAIKRGPGYLVLVESATLEIIETVATLVTLPSSLRAVVVHAVTDICRSYYKHLGHKVSDRYVPLPVEEYEQQFNASGQEYEESVDLICATEEFAIAHEWGHIVLGHALVNTTCAFDKRDTFEVIDDETRTKAQQDEYAADLWSIGMLMKSRRTSKRLDSVIEGAFLFLCLARQFEGYMDTERINIGTHPSAAERLWMIDRLGDKYIRNRGSYSQKHSSETVRHILDECYKSEFGRPPPNVDFNEPTMLKLYTKLVQLIFPYDKNLW